MSLDVRHSEQRTLFELLKIQKKNPDTQVIGLKESILGYMASMDQNDVKLVQKMIAELD